MVKLLKCRDNLEWQDLEQKTELGDSNMEEALMAL